MIDSAPDTSPDTPAPSYVTPSSAPAPASSPAGPEEFPAPAAVQACAHMLHIEWI